jgi:hypothetical protein
MSIGDSSSARERRVRRLARRLGYGVRKSRANDSLDNRGRFMLVQVDRNTCVLGDRFDANLDEIEAFLNK